jgi:hypothetical protein
MGLLQIVMAIYIFTTIFALMMTYHEQKKRGHQTPVFVMIGYVSCMVWPLVGAVMFYTHKASLRAQSI